MKNIYEVFLIDGDFRDWEENPELPFIKLTLFSFDQVVALIQIAADSGLQVVVRKQHD